MPANWLKTFVLLASLFLLAFGLARFAQSEDYKRKADKLIKEGKPEEAILLYNKALDAFTFRKDVIDSLEGAHLIIESDLKYVQFYQVGPELQVQPPISELPKYRAPKEKELFVPILMYHHIRENPHPENIVWQTLHISPKFLDEELNYLETHNFHVIGLDDLYEALTSGKALPENPIVLTFDDGYRSFYENAFPLLKKHNMKAIDFVITQGVGASAYLTWDEIAEMDRSGLIQFGAHTRHHANLPDLSHNSIIEEIKGSKADLESHLHKKIDWFAYPYGSYNDFAISVVEEAGFKGAVSTIYGPIQSKDNLFLMHRIMANGRYGLDNFVMRITR